MERWADDKVKRVKREACSQRLELELESENCGVQEGVDKEERGEAQPRLVRGARCEVRSA